MVGSRVRTIERIKQAAVYVWARHGFHGASVKMIAEEASANVSLINRYFGGKDGLLNSLVQEMIERKQGGELDYAPQPTLREEVLEYLRFRYREDMKQRELMQLVISEIITNEHFRKNALKSVTYGADKNFLKRLWALQEAGVIGATVDLSGLFRQVSLFSFSCSFIEGIVLGLSPEKTDEVMRQFAVAVERGSSTGELGMPNPASGRGSARPPRSTRPRKIADE